MRNRRALVFFIEQEILLLDMANNDKRKKRQADVIPPKQLNSFTLKRKKRKYL